MLRRRLRELAEVAARGSAAAPRSQLPARAENTPLDRWSASSAAPTDGRWRSLRSRSASGRAGRGRAPRRAPGPTCRGRDRRLADQVRRARADACRARAACEELRAAQVGDPARPTSWASPIRQTSTWAVDSASEEPGGRDESARRRSRRARRGDAAHASLEEAPGERGGAEAARQAAGRAATAAAAPGTAGRSGRCGRRARRRRRR